MRLPRHVAGAGIPRQGKSSTWVAPFNSAEACLLSGVSYRQLHYWTSTKLIRPSVREANGSGSSRLWSENDIAKLRTMKTLLDLGVSLRTIRKDRDPEVTINRLVDGCLRLIQRERVA